MKFIFIAIVFLSSLTVFAKETICVNRKIAFSIDKVKGFSLDSTNADKLKLCTLFVLDGHDFDSSPAVIYPSMIDTKASLNNVIEEDKKSFLKNSVTAFVVKRNNFKNKHGLTFEVRQFNNGKAPNEFELVYYHKNKNSIIIVVLSSRDKNIVSKYKNDFEKIIDTIEVLKKKK